MGYLSAETRAEQMNIAQWITSWFLVWRVFDDFFTLTFDDSFCSATAKCGVSIHLSYYSSYNLTWSTPFGAFISFYPDTNSYYLSQHFSLFLTFLLFFIFPFVRHKEIVVTAGYAIFFFCVSFVSFRFFYFMYFFPSISRREWLMNVSQLPGYFFKLDRNWWYILSLHLYFPSCHDTSRKCNNVGKSVLSGFTFPHTLHGTPTHLEEQC